MNVDTSACPGHRRASICSAIMGSMPKLLPTIEVLTASCCAPLAEAPLSEDAAAVLANRLKAVAEPAPPPPPGAGPRSPGPPPPVRATGRRAGAGPPRLRLVSLVLASPGQEACICDLTGPLGLSQPTISHHMKVLVDAGLLIREKRGRWAYFRVVPQAFESLAQALQPKITS